MASQPSVYNEERNILRLRAWEQRNQETSQAKELNTERVPLFGEPYKTNKGDELSNRIQRMLGSYEDVNNQYPFPTEHLPIPTCVTFSQSDPGQTNMDKTTQPPFQQPDRNTSSHTQTAACSSSHPSQPMRTSTDSSPNHCGQLPTFSAHNQRKSEARSDLREQEISSQSPDAQQLPFLRSSDHDNTNMDVKENTDRHQLQGSTNHLSESACTVDFSTFNIKQSPKDTPLSQANKSSALPSQTFPSLLSSKQPSVVITQKPTAYVRPMDGPDQVLSESPELKPSPEPYTPLPEIISKSDLGKGKVVQQFLETRTNEAQCVEDILKEMTHSWPPLLSALHTPGTGEPSRSPFPTEEAEHVSSCPVQKKCTTSPQRPAQPIQLSSSSSIQAAHSRGAESASSSDSESSSRSDSDSESTTEEPPQPSVSSSVKSEPDAPAVTHGDWQLGNWIRSSQQSSRAESQSAAHTSESPTHKPPPPTQSSKHSYVEVVDPSRETKPQPSCHQKDCPGKPHLKGEGPQDNYNQQSNQKSLPVDLNSCSKKLSRNKNSSVPAKVEAALGVKCKEVVAMSDKDTCFKDRPKVKTKTGHGKKIKNSCDTKRDNKRTSKHTTLDKRKAETPAVLHAHCPSCVVQNPNLCSCPTPSTVQTDQPSPAATVTVTCSKPKLETTCQKGSKIPHKTILKNSKKTAAKSSREQHRTLQTLLVKIDLTLLSRVPQSSGSHQETPITAKRSVLVIEPDGGGSDAATTHKVSKTSKKSIPQNVEVEKTIPRKKQKLENKNTSLSRASTKLKTSTTLTEGKEQTKTKKNPSQPPATTTDSAKDSKSLKRCPVKTQEHRKEPAKSKDVRKHKRISGKHTEQLQSEKKPPKCSFTIPSSSQFSRESLTKRPMLQFEDRQHPVKHYIKEAKKLKHKADAESDKLIKAFNYLDAAMFFVESGIAMEKDPQISMSSYTMFAETVELLKFVLKLKSSEDSAAPASENDFLALCLKCQSLLQMAMFRHKQKTALKYSKILSEHFNISAQKTPDPSVPAMRASNTPSPMPNVPSPANTTTSSGPGSNHSGGGSFVDPSSSSVAVPKTIQQVAFTYVNITTLFLSAHDMWEQAEEMARKGSGLLADLDTVMEPLSLTSSMSAMVCYTRQGVHWLRLDSQMVK